MTRLLLMITLLWVGTTTARAQNPALYYSYRMGLTLLQDITKPYFKTVPYDKLFSSFLHEVLNDPDLQGKVVKPRTDSTFFYTSGTYKRFNSLIYRPTTLKLIVTEALFSASDTSSHVDTVIYCQLLVTTDTTARSEQFVKKEYSRLLRKYDRKFTYDTYPLGAPNGANRGEVAHCFIAPFVVSPLTVAWGRNEATREYVFSISLRMKVQENWAGMVTLPHEPIRIAQ